MTSRADDEKFMARAIEVSLRHQGQTQTNPSVGCVLVKDGKIIAEAVTAIGGRPHAERQALEIAGEAARGATAYVTLEPCSHWGKTPPCANALVEFGVARVVVAVDDPDERVSGRGYTILRDAGIVVETGLLREQGKRALAGYLTRQLKKRPHVILKLALQPEFKDYAAQVVKNAKALAETLIEGGLDVVSGGTDNHLMLVDLRKKNATGKRAEAALGRAYVTCNKNGIPFDPEKPFVTSGVRLGTPAGTTRGFKEAEFREIGKLIVEVLDGLKVANSDEGNAAVEAAVREKVVGLTDRFPMYPYM